MTTDSRDSPRTPDPASRPSPGSAPAPTVGPVPRAGVADHDLTSRTARSVLWTVLRSGVTNVLQIVVYFTLLALLVPEDFGLVAAATVFIATISFLVNGGFAEALIQRSELTGRQINTAFWAGNAIAAVMTCGTLLFAFLGPFDRFFDDPRIVWILAALTLHLPLTALISVPQALLAREMRFKTLAKVEVIAALASSATGIGVALAGGGAWALVMQTMTQRALTVAGCWVAAGWRPAFEFDRAEVKPLVSFGSSLVGVRFMEHLANYADQFLVGGFLSLAALGIYQVGQRVSEQVLVVMYLTVGATALPALAKLQGDRDRLNRVTVGGSQLLVFLGVPMFVGLAVIAPDFVLLFDEEWEGAGPVMGVLALAGVSRCMTYLPGRAIVAVGKPHYRFFSAGVNALLVFPIFFSVYEYGVIAVALGALARAVIDAPLVPLLCRAATGYSVTMHFVETARPLFASGAMGVALYVGRGAMGDVSPLFALVVMVPVGAVLYALFSLVVARRAVERMLYVSRSVLPGRVWRLAAPIASALRLDPRPVSAAP